MRCSRSRLKRPKPTRRDLLVVVGRLQVLIGLIQARNNDRNQYKADEVDPLLEEAHELCISARSLDPPLGDVGPWSAAEEKRQREAEGVEPPLDF